MLTIKIFNIDCIVFPLTKDYQLEYHHHFGMRGYSCSGVSDSGAWSKYSRTSQNSHLGSEEHHSSWSHIVAISNDELF